MTQLVCTYNGYYRGDAFEIGKVRKIITNDVGRAKLYLKLLYKNIPIFDENTTSKDILKVSNDLKNEDSWNKIAADFQQAIDNLPINQPELARANKYAAQAYLAKLKSYQAYEQDAAHKVTAINQVTLKEVVSLIQSVVASGKYSLINDIADDFLPEIENSHESVFAIQFTNNDGTTAGRMDFEDGLIIRTAHHNMIAVVFML